MTDYKKRTTNRQQRSIANSEKHRYMAIHKTLAANL